MPGPIIADRTGSAPKTGLFTADSKTFHTWGDPLSHGICGSCRTFFQLVLGRNVVLVNLVFLDPTWIAPGRASMRTVHDRSGSSRARRRDANERPMTILQEEVGHKSCGTSCWDLLRTFHLELRQTHLLQNAKTAIHRLHELSSVRWCNSALCSFHQNQDSETPPPSSESRTSRALIFLIIRSFP